MKNQFKYYTTPQNSIYKKQVVVIFALLLVTIGLLSCKKFLEVGPPKDTLVRSEVFKDDNSATSAMVGIYSNMMNSTFLISSTVSWYPGLNADELVSPSNSASAQPFARNEIPVDHSEVLNAWSQGYSYVYDSSAIIEGLENSTGVTPATKNQLLGEAKFTRAFVYFYLTNLFGDVPLLTTTDYRISTVAGRAAQTSVYAQMINDLKEAQALLPENYATTERVRPNKWAATSLLARVYLYNHDWSLAETESSAVINSGVYSLSAPANTFLKGSNETILQFYSVNTSYNTQVAMRYIPSSSTAAPTYSVTADLVNSFESGDLRKTNWISTSVAAGITYYYPFKYKVRSGGTTLSEHLIVLRLAESYLIRAEARTHLNNNLISAIDDINIIRTRARLPNLPSTLNQQQIFLAIEKERRIELFSENGHRWFDLKRTGRIDAVMQAFKPSTWKSTAALWPIPLTQINTNKQLTQNPGYN